VNTASAAGTEARHSDIKLKSDILVIDLEAREPGGTGLRGELAVPDR
jgi:hypothetical protein